MCVVRVLVSVCVSVCDGAVRAGERGESFGAVFAENVENVSALYCALF